MPDQPTSPAEPGAGADVYQQTLTTKSSETGSSQNWSSFFERLIRLGLGDLALRIATILAFLALVLAVSWVMSNFYLKGQVTSYHQPFAAASLTTPTPQVGQPAAESPADKYTGLGIFRLAEIHTSLPAKPRFDILEYEVVKGDTLFSIAQKFNLRPESLLWGNYNVLADNPHSLRPGQKLVILPVNGVYYTWHAGDGLNSVAKFYGVAPELIAGFPGNHFDPATLGDFAKPNIEPGTNLIIPGGKREFVAWSAPRITRTNPAVAKIFGPGACGKIMDGNIGNGSFIWPTANKFLSGFGYSPDTNHYAIDIAGLLGNAVFAADGGVVVYAGWNDFGYGNVLVLDHGNGWQSLYAHLNSMNVECGGSVAQGAVIGTVGNTGNSSGPHLHFELRSDTYGRVNPEDFLQK